MGASPQTLRTPTLWRRPLASAPTSNLRVDEMTDEVVFLLDVDNTLLDNDRVIEDLRGHLVQSVGSACAVRYWTIFEKLRSELGYADYLGALQRFRVEAFDESTPDPVLLQLSGYLIDYPFSDRLFPGALRAIDHLRRVGKTTILSDGDVVFQPRKVQRSGLWQAVEGRVMIYIHKEQMLDAVQRRFPSQHYVMMDDKLRLLEAMKQTLGRRLTTVFIRQGHYAFEPQHIANYPPADITLECIADLVNVDFPDWLRKRSVHIALKNNQ
jgi:FMN phosphatase YigB (HAD superfamily)